MLPLYPSSIDTFHKTTLLKAIKFCCQRGRCCLYIQVVSTPFTRKGYSKQSAAVISVDAVLVLDSIDTFHLDNFIQKKSFAVEGVGATFIPRQFWHFQQANFIKKQRFFVKGDDAAIIAKQCVYLPHDSCSKSKDLLWRGSVLLSYQGRFDTFNKKTLLQTKLYCERCQCSLYIQAEFKPSTSLL